MQTKEQNSQINAQRVPPLIANELDYSSNASDYDKTLTEAVAQGPQETQETMQDYSTLVKPTSETPLDLGALLP